MEPNDVIHENVNAVSANMLLPKLDLIGPEKVMTLIQEYGMACFKAGLAEAHRDAYSMKADETLNALLAIFCNRHNTEEQTA